LENERKIIETEYSKEQPVDASDASCHLIVDASLWNDATPIYDDALDDGFPSDAKWQLTAVVATVINVPNDVNDEHAAVTFYGNAIWNA
jgi:hypothetical protein